VTDIVLDALGNLYSSQGGRSERSPVLNALQPEPAAVIVAPTRESTICPSCGVEG